ncbi:MAG: DUF6588 family protein [Daejeonella sp.]
MKKNNFVLTITFISFLSLSSLTSFAQGDAAALIKSGSADATKLVQAYLKPVFKGFGHGLNSGWNNTANAKSFLRFDVRLGVTGAIIPESDQSFDVAKLGLSNNIGITPGQQGTFAPTAVGKQIDGPVLTVYSKDKNEPDAQEIESFTLPKGANIPLIPAPELQATVGLPRGIDVSLRFAPKINVGEDLGSVSMFGAGAKMEILRFLAGKDADKVFPVDVAIAAGFTQFNYKIPLDVPAPAPNEAVPENAQQPTDFSNQLIDAKLSGVNVEAIVSKKFLFFTPFLSVGYQTSQTSIGLKGNYPIINGYNPVTLQNTYTVLTNPINLTQNDVNGMRANLGFQVNLLFLRLYASYTMSEYNSFNAGIGFGMGK